ncbi:MAG: hypothetical protein OCD00_10880 [Colwellia sp.]
MSRKQDEDKALANDEAFIDALYVELESIELESAELENVELEDSKRGKKAINDQPSKELDQRIIAAAHKSAATKAPVIELSNITVLKRKKRPVWTIPFATAASLVLVVSLVMNQQDSPIPAVNNDFFVESSMQSPVMAQSEPLLETKVASTYKRVTLAQQKRSEYKQQKSKELSRKRSKARSANMFLLSEPEAIASNALSVAQFTKKELLINDSPTLTHQQYVLFIKQQARWSLVSEHEDYYVINISSRATENTAEKENSNNVVQYKLLKKAYRLKSLTELSELSELSELANDSTKRLLNEFVLIEENNSKIN